MMSYLSSIWGFMHVYLIMSAVFWVFSRTKNSVGDPIAWFLPAMGMVLLALIGWFAVSQTRRLTAGICRNFRKLRSRRSLRNKAKATNSEGFVLALFPIGFMIIVGVCVTESVIGMLACGISGLAIASWFYAEYEASCEQARQQHAILCRVWGRKRGKPGKRIDMKG